MKKTSRFISTVLIAALSLTMMAGCKDSKDTVADISATTSSGVESSSGEATLEPMTLTMYNQDGVEDLWKDPVALKITEATGITLKTDYPVDGTDQMVSLMIAEGKYPDLVFAKGNGVNLIEADALIDMTDLIEQYGPNIKKLYGDYMTRLRYSKEDPKIYQLCSNAVGNVSYTSSGTAQIQYDALVFNEYKVPATLAEYEDLMKRYIAANPKIDGLDTIGFTLSAADWHWMITLGNPAGFIADAAPDNGQWLIDDKDNYKVTYKHTSAAEKEYFAWMNRMFTEGILDKDFATQSHDEYLAKIATGRVVGLFDTQWDYNTAEQLLKKDGKVNRTYAGLPLTMTADQKSPALIDQGLSVGWGVGISKDCKDPIRAIKFIDWMCTEEAQILLNWGIEGVNYTVNDKGMRVRSEEEIKASKEDKDYKKNTGIGFHNYPFPVYGNGIPDSKGDSYSTTTKQSVIDTYSQAEKDAVKAWNVELLIDIFPQKDQFEIPAYSPVWSQNKPSEFLDKETILNDIAWPGLIQCIMAPEGQFYTKWQDLQDKLVKADVEGASTMLTEIIQAQVDFWAN